MPKPLSKPNRKSSTLTQEPKNPQPQTLLRQIPGIETILHTDMMAHQAWATGSVFCLIWWGGGVEFRV